MKIAIYSPYLDTAGGGEKYILTIAEILSSENSVDVTLDKHLNEVGIDYIKERNEDLHGLDLSKVNFIIGPFGKGSSNIDRIFFLRKYDWFFYLTDGSIFFSTAKNSIIHFQVPFKNIAAGGVLGRIKLSSWKKAIFNSQFTKEYVLRFWSVEGEVIYPPVNIQSFKPLKKKNQILSVGRFFGYTKSKKHELMIDAFKKLVDDRKLNDWSLHLAGGIGKGDKEYVDDLKKLAKGYQIIFYPEVSLNNLEKLYGESQIYWHAAGYGEDDPVNMEHFGITTVEAMSAGCVPVVVRKGGLVEIVEDGKNGFLWASIGDLFDKTYKLISQKDLLGEMSVNAQKGAIKFSKEEFIKNINNLIYG